MDKRNQMEPQKRLAAQERKLLEDFSWEAEAEENLKPLQTVNGFQIRPGFYEINGDTGFPNGVNFTLISRSATSCCCFTGAARPPMPVFPFRRNTGWESFTPCLCSG